MGATAAQIEHDHVGVQTQMPQIVDKTLFSRGGDADRFFGGPNAAEHLQTSRTTLERFVNRTPAAEHFEKGAAAWRGSPRGRATMFEIGVDPHRAVTKSRKRDRQVQGDRRGANANLCAADANQARGRPFRQPWLDGQPSQSSQFVCLIVSHSSRELYSRLLLVGQAPA